MTKIKRYGVLTRRHVINDPADYADCLYHDARFKKTRHTLMDKVDRLVKIITFSDCVYVLAMKQAIKAELPIFLALYCNVAY